MADLDGGHGANLESCPQQILNWAGSASSTARAKLEHPFLGCGIIRNDGDFLSTRRISKTKKTKEGKYQCPLDEQVFETKADFDKHFRLVHVSELGVL